MLGTGSLNGIEIIFGFGLAVVGVIASFVAKRAGRSPFYFAPMATEADPGSPDLAGAGT